jgi:multimeric flavodoxin WrbA
MRIMTIVGSPRRQGNTAKVLSWIEDRRRSEGHEVDRAHILD